jgi:DNA-binding NarL/FixJ family response regulator
VKRIGISVRARTTSAPDALAALEEHRPDLFVTETDTNDAEMDGIAVFRRARESLPGLKAIVVSSRHDPQYIDAALAAGAVAYVLKTAHPDDLASAIRQAFEHSIFLAGPRPTAPAPAGDSQPPRPAEHDLTSRELEILRLVAEGHTNAELAKMLWVTEQTVKFHLSNVYRKLGVSNRTEASRKAQVLGLLTSAAKAS